MQRRWVEFRPISAPLGSFSPGFGSLLAPIDSLLPLLSASTASPPLSAGRSGCPVRKFRFFIYSPSSVGILPFLKLSKRVPDCNGKHHNRNTNLRLVTLVRH